MDGQNDENCQAELDEVKRELKTMREERAALQEMGVEYCECPICEAQFMSVGQRNKHISEHHEWDS